MRVNLKRIASWKRSNRLKFSLREDLKMFCGLKLSCCWLVCCVLVVLQVQFTSGQLAHNFYAGRSIVSDSAFNKVWLFQGFLLLASANCPISCNNERESMGGVGKVASTEILNMQRKDFMFIWIVTFWKYFQQIELRLGKQPECLTVLNILTKN